MSSDDHVSLVGNYHVHAGPHVGKYLVVNGRRAGIITAASSTTLTYAPLRWWQKLYDWARRCWRVALLL